MLPAQTKYILSEYLQAREICDKIINLNKTEYLDRVYNLRRKINLALMDCQ